MRLTFAGKDPDSNPTGSPMVYRTDRESWIVQGKLSSADHADIRLCRSAFEPVWKLSIPHREYKPV